MTTAQPDRLDRLENIVDSIARSLDNLVTAQGNQQTMIDRLADGQLGLQAQMGIMSQIVIETREETKQLKRAVDYLLGRDGERGVS
jgi:predicted phage-related endonuclease